MSVKFIDLNPINSPADDDIFVLTDLSEGTTKHISYLDLKQSVVDTAVFIDNATNIISSLNNFNNGSGSNGLNADTLDDEDGAYYLDYGNFTNTPTVPTDLSQLLNSTGFVRYDTSSSPAKLVFENNTGPSSFKISVRSDNITEGTENLFYTDARVGQFFNDNFASYYSQYTSTFEENSAQNSQTDIDGTFINLDVQAQFTQSKDIELANSDDTIYYSTGQIVRLYGASDVSTTEKGEVATTFNAVPAGFALTNQNSPFVSFSYKIAEFSFENGMIGEDSSAISFNIAIPDNLLPTVTDIRNAFNLDNFVNITFSNVPSNTGLLLYRSIAGGDYKLFGVLGPKEIELGFYIDYMNFDYVPWSGKEANENTYTSDIIHFPNIISTTARQGWIDRTIESVDAVNGTITLNDYVKINPGASVEIAHNDTSLLQSAINNNFTIGRRDITLNAKTYVSSELFMPSNFAINGSAYITKIKKLPWSGYEGGIPSGRLLNSVDDSGAENISLVGFDIDGCLPNQYLFAEGGDIAKNYCIDFGFGSDSTLVDKVRITNVIAGGVYMPEASNLNLVNSQILNSGSTDRYEYSPLVIGGGENIIIANNRFENFTDYIDTSVTDKGVVTNNIISNCGSGLLTYGSRFFISSPNVLIGPAGEFLPTTDILNSVYDSVNITLETGTQYTSDVYVYQENGVAFNLRGTVASGERNRLLYGLYKLSKSAAGQESLYEEITDVTISDVPAGVDRTKGEFKFSISSTDVDTILDTYSVANMVALNEDHVGLVYRVQLEEHVRAGTLVLGQEYSANTSANTSSYTVNVEDADYLFVGATVETIQHGIGSDGPLSSTATVTEILGTGSNLTITVEFEGIINALGSGGYINILNNFTLVQGRVL